MMDEFDGFVYATEGLLEMIDRIKMAEMHDRRNSFYRCKAEENEARRCLDVKDGRVIFQDKDTVLVVGDKRYVAKCEAGDKYDKEKGLLVCLIKAMGLTTSDVEKMLSRAEVKKSSKKGKGVK